MAQRDDARVAEDQVERQREERGDGDLARQHEVVREQHERQQRRRPERNLDRTPPRLRLQMEVGVERRS
jgi:hypothetical protein